MQKENSNGKQEMSFSGKIKEELARQWSEARHCQIAELVRDYQHVWKGFD